MSASPEIRMRDGTSDTQAHSTKVPSALDGATNQQAARGGAHTNARPPPGYPALAQQMTLHPQHAIFRQFGYLNYLNLLYMQAELVHVEHEVKQRQKEDSAKDGPEKKCAADWVSSSDQCQASLFQGASEKLARYNTALIRQSQIIALQTPERSDLEGLQNFLASKEMGPGTLNGLDSEVWGTTENRNGHEADVVALFPRLKADMFSNFVLSPAMREWYRWGLHCFMLWASGL